MLFGGHVVAAPVGRFVHHTGREVVVGAVVVATVVPCAHQTEAIDFSVCSVEGVVVVGQGVVVPCHAGLPHVVGGYWSLLPCLCCPVPAPVNPWQCRFVFVCWCFPLAKPNKNIFLAK